MNIEIIKEIKLTNHGIKIVGSVITDIPEDQGGTLIRMGFAKESEISKEDAKVIAEIEAEESEKLKADKEPRKRRTKAEIEADKNKK